MSNAFELNEILKILGYKLTSIVSAQFAHRMACLFFRQLIKNLELGKSFRTINHEEDEAKTAMVIFRSDEIRMTTV